MGQVSNLTGGSVGFADRSDRSRFGAGPTRITWNIVPAICVFCGSSSGTSPAYAEAARHVGTVLARRGSGWSTAAGGSG